MLNVNNPKPCDQCGVAIGNRNLWARYCKACISQRTRESVRRSRVRSIKVNRTDGAYRIVWMAIRYGFLPHPKTQKCVDCGEGAECYDHRDYNRPLDVEPVCHPCNVRRGPGIPFDESRIVV